jgi:adenylosuccinate lyase
MAEQTNSTNAPTQSDPPAEAIYGYDTYLSPLTWRYGSDEMRRLWSEVEKRRLLRRFWVALAEAQCEVGIVSVEQVADLSAHVDDIDVPMT